MTRGTRNILRAAIAGTSLLALIAVGCSNKPEAFPRRRQPVAMVNAGDEVVMPATQRTDLVTFNTFSIYGNPPAGWTKKANTADPRAEHIVWTSPGGNTAFGVIFFHLPWPIGHDLTFRYGVLPEAKRREGSAEVLMKKWDPEIEGLRFEIRTPRYTAETKMFVRGTRGWAAYSGYQTTRPVNQEELEQAVRAREDVEFGEEIEPKPATRKTQNSAADERR